MQSLFLQKQEKNWRMGLWLMYLPRNVKRDCVFEDAEQVYQKIEEEMEKIVKEKLEKEN